MSIQFRIQFTIIAEHHPNGFIGINDAEFEIGTETVLQEIAMVRRYLKTVRTPHLHQSLISSLSGHGMLDFLGQLQ
jgi:hypothetical protein